ncbi:MAG: DUF2232 domain-containing protein [Synergistaceae bacterium]|nr:DUF2232 domain-containing protein [Synergistaceae bacterium]
MKVNNPFIEWFGWVMLSVVMYVVGMGLIVTAPFVVLVAPVPFMALMRRQGYARAMIGAFAASASVYTLSGPSAAAMFIISFGMLGVAMGVISLHAKTGVDCVAASIVVSVFSKIFLMAVFSRVAGVNPFAVTPEAAGEMVKMAVSAGSIPGVSAGDVKAYAKNISESVSLLMPSMLIVFAAADSLFSYVLTSKVLVRMGSDGLKRLPPFGDWRCPKNIFWALIASLILDALSKAQPDERIFTVLSVNMMEVVRGVLTLQGLSLAWYFMSKRGVHKSLMVFFVIIGLIISPVAYVLSMVGVFDIWYDLRKRIRRNSK